MIHRKREELSFLEGMQPIVLFCEGEATESHFSGYARMWKTKNDGNKQKWQLSNGVIAQAKVVNLVNLIWLEIS